MARAKVTLRNSETFQGLQDVIWKKGQSRTLTKSDEIEYYRRQSEFVVTDLAAPKAKAAPASPPPSDDDAPKLTEAELAKHTKAELVEFGADEFGLDLNPDDRKDDLIAQILEAQG